MSLHNQYQKYVPSYQHWLHPDIVKQYLLRFIFYYHIHRAGLKLTDCCHTDDLTYLIWQPLPPYVMDDDGNRSESSMK